MKINNINSFYNVSQNKKSKEKNEITATTQRMATKPFELRAKFNDHLISFGARVDKGLERFYEANKDRMPYSAKLYIESLEDKTRLTPLEAQKRAFVKLENAKNVNDIKKDFGFEPLFQDLIEASESNAKRGLLFSVKENEEILSLSGEGVLKDKSDLTVYLVKKIFLEGKTINEINVDLEKDLNEDFKADFKYKNKDNNTEPKYVYTSTLKALGIQAPPFEYQQSLRYTKDGYADSVGEKISQGQRAFWDAMPTAERTERAKKSVQKFETWWSGFSQNEKLDMIAKQLSELDLLKLYKKSQRAEDKELKAKGLPSDNDSEVSESQEVKTKGRPHTKVGSSVLGKDDLFKMWAKNNLKIYEENLSEAQKDTLHLKRMQNLTSRWANMSPVERTDYISKMKAGAEPLRYTMIDAWNHSTDLIKALSSHLKENQIYKPADLLYSTQEFSNFQSKVMTEFWEQNPELTASFGQKIIESQEKVQLAISRGTFDALKNQINRDKKDRIREIENFKSQQAEAIEANPAVAEEADYKKDFRAAYDKHVYGKTKSMPKNYFTDMYDTVLKLLPKEAVMAWTKNLNGIPLSFDERTVVNKFVKNELPEISRYNRAIEASIAKVLFETTKNPDVYTMSNSDVKMALYHLERGESPMELHSHKNGKTYKLNIINKKFNPAEINFLYEKYKQDLSDEQLDDILDKYFENSDRKELNNLIKNSTVPVRVNGFDRNQMKGYLNQHGKSALILFSEKSAFPISVKKSFYEKFKANMPEEMNDQSRFCVFDKEETFDSQMKMKRLNDLFAKKFSFVPRDFIDSYFVEIEKILKNPINGLDAEVFETKCCVKRKSANDAGKLAIVDKKTLSIENKIKTLAIEQALADVLYESTGNMTVYSLPFEELAENIEIFSLVKKFPSEQRHYKTIFNGEYISINANKKPNTYKIERLYKEYMEELDEWMDSGISEDSVPDLEELLFILNPDENLPDKDDAVSGRILKYGLMPQ